MVMKTLLIISFLILLTYIIYMIKQVGVTTSLSESYYKIKYRWLFPVVMGITGIMVMLYLLEITDERWFQFLSFLAPAALLFVAVAPDYKQILEGQVHRAAAIMSAVFGVLLMVLLGYWYVPVIFLVIAAVIIKHKGNKVFWLEMGAFASLYTALFLDSVL